MDRVLADYQATPRSAAPARTTDDAANVPGCVARTQVWSENQGWQSLQETRRVREWTLQAPWRRVYRPHDRGGQGGCEVEWPVGRSTEETEPREGLRNADFLASLRQ